MITKLQTYALSVLIIGALTFVPTHATLYEDTCDFLIERWGQPGASQKNVALIRSIQKELSMSDWTIRIRTMTSEFRHDTNIVFDGRSIHPSFYYRSNKIRTTAAFAFGNYLTGMLFINEETFDTLSPEEQRFAIGRELMYLKKRYFLQRIAFGGLSIIPSAIVGLIVFTVPVYLAANTWFARTCNIEADAMIAQELKDAKGGIELFNRVEKNLVNPPSRFTIKKVFHNIMEPLTYFFLSGKAYLGDRIDNLRGVEGKA